MPRFQFYCPKCNLRDDHFCMHAEIPGQVCAQCGGKLAYEFVATRSRPIVYANDTKHPAVFTGPKQREKYLQAHGLIDYGSESPDTVRKETDRMAREAEAKEDAAMHKTVMDSLAELGDAGMYQSTPKHVADREAREAREEARDQDLTGAAVGRPHDQLRG